MATEVASSVVVPKFIAPRQRSRVKFSVTAAIIPDLSTALR
jgi:hypothetical protein